MELLQLQKATERFYKTGRCAHHDVFRVTFEDEKNKVTICAICTQTLTREPLKPNPENLKALHKKLNQLTKTVNVQEIEIETILKSLKGIFEEHNKRKSNFYEVHKIPLDGGQFDTERMNNNKPVFNEDGAVLE